MLFIKIVPVLFIETNSTFGSFHVNILGITIRIINAKVSLIEEILSAKHASHLIISS